METAGEATTVSWPDRIAEGAWLLALLVLPLVFDTAANQAFELPKLILLALLAGVSALCVAGALIRHPERQGHWSMALLAAVWLIVLLVSTVRSSNPAESFWGGYHRHTGLLSALALVSLGAGPWMFLRTPAQLYRLCVAIASSASLAALYGVAQRLGLDPFNWIGRPLGVTSVLGSSTALGGYLAISIPVTLMLALAAAQKGKPSPWPIMSLLFAAAGFQACALLLTSVRAAVVATVLGVACAIAIFAWNDHRISHARLVALLTVAAILAVGGVALLSVWRGASAGLDRASLPRADTSVTERYELWKSAARALNLYPADGNGSARGQANEPAKLWLLGAGPDRQADVLEPWLSTELTERLAATRFDRAHHSVLDTLLTSGLTGLVAIAALVVTSLTTGWRLVRTKGAASSILAVGLISAVLAFLIDTSVSFPSITSLTFVAIVIGALGGASQSTDHSGRKLPLRGPFRVVTISATVVIAVILIGALPLLVLHLGADRTHQRALAAMANEELSHAIDLERDALQRAPHRTVYAAQLVELLISRAASAPRDDSGRPEVLNASPSVGELLTEATEVAEAAATRSGSADPFVALLAAQAYDQAADADVGHPGAGDRAVEFGLDAIRLGPQRIELRDVVAQMAARHGRPEEALRLLAEAERMDERGADRLAEAGHVYRALGQQQSASQRYQRALELDEHSAAAWWGVSQLAIAEGRLADALEPAEQAARYAMRDWRYHRDLGRIHRALGNRSEARQELRSAARLAPSWHWPELRAEADALGND